MSEANKGRKFTEEHKLRMGEAISRTRRQMYLEGKLKPWNKGKARDEKTKDKLSKISLNLWKDKNYIEKWEKGMNGKIMPKPSSAECRFMGLLAKHDLPFLYVGNGYTFINGRNPDFIDFGKKQIIEVFGNYWHEKQEMEDRISHFAKYGYRTLIVWENELSNEDTVICKINDFITT